MIAPVMAATPPRSSLRHEGLLRRGPEGGRMMKAKAPVPSPNMPVNQRIHLHVVSCTKTPPMRNPVTFCRRWQDGEAQHKRHIRRKEGCGNALFPMPAQLPKTAMAIFCSSGAGNHSTMRLRADGTLNAAPTPAVNDKESKKYA